MSEDKEPEANVDDKQHRVVHLRRAEYEDPAVRAAWQERGYATMPPMEGHDPHRRCPICSTDEEPKKDCPYCGEGPCLLRQLLGGT
jgi:hypothetical protein